MADSNLQMSATPCRVVIAWEMGGNLGHLTRCASVSEALQRQGLGTLLALRETSPIIPHTSGTWIVPAPRLAARHERRRAPPANFAELLLLQGYADPTALRES